MSKNTGLRKWLIKRVVMPTKQISNHPLSGRIVPEVDLQVGVKMNSHGEGVIVGCRSG